MATLSTFRPCTYTGEADFEAIANLINTCRAADDIDYRMSVTDVRYFSELKRSLQKTIVVPSIPDGAMRKRRLSLGVVYQKQPSSRGISKTNAQNKWASFPSTVCL